MLSFVKMGAPSRMDFCGLLSSRTKALRRVEDTPFGSDELLLLEANGGEGVAMDLTDGVYGELECALG